MTDDKETAPEAATPDVAGAPAKPAPASAVTQVAIDKVLADTDAAATTLKQAQRLATDFGRAQPAISQHIVNKTQAEGPAVSSAGILEAALITKMYEKCFGYGLKRVSPAGVEAAEKSLSGEGDTPKRPLEDRQPILVAHLDKVIAEEADHLADEHKQLLRGVLHTVMAAYDDAVQGQTPRTLEPIRSGPKVGRNDPCPCGSSKKYKKCHGASDAAA